MQAADKPLVVMEWDWTAVDQRDAFMRAVEGTDVVAGTAFWSLFPHADTYGSKPGAELEKGSRRRRSSSHSRRRLRPARSYPRAK